MAGSVMRTAQDKKRSVGGRKKTRLRCRRRVRASWNGWSGLPESGKCPAVRRFAQLLERALAYLADPLAGDAHELSNPLEGHRFGALVEAVVQVQDLPLAGGEVALEDAIDELAHQLVVRD